MKINRLAFGIGLLLVMLFACTSGNGRVNQGVPAEDTIVIDVSKPLAEISESMYGVFFEEINHAGDGGLLAELVENGNFQELEMPEGYHAEGDRLYSPVKFHHTNGKNVQTDYRWTTDPVPGWKIVGNASMSLTKINPYYESAPTNLKVCLSESASLVNDGFWGMNIKNGDKYILRTVIRADKDFTGAISARLLSEDGNVIAESSLAKTPVDNSWIDSSVILDAMQSADSASLELKIDGTGTLYMGYVSLLPEDTFDLNGHKLPLRKDVAQKLVDLKPSFIRWPGGCVVEGISLENRFEWKKSLGDPASRSGQYSTWGYRCSYGFGYHEMMSFCEAIGASAMFVCNVGLGCQAREGDLCLDSEIGFYLDDCMDAIEYAIGSVNTEWGALRAKAGHPEVFPLKYVEIGNENRGPEYEKHFNIFYKAIKAKYPDLILISNYGVNGIGDTEKCDMVDPHWYVHPDYFFTHTHLFDTVSRGSYTVYVGEYAANTGVGSGNMRAALSEAAWIGGMERNGDLVKMCSYAPLFENANDRVWPVNLIWINSSKTLGRSSYYVQKMAADNRPDCNVFCNKYESDRLIKSGAEGSSAEYPAAFFSAGFDKSASEVVFKVVNADTATFVLNLSLKGTEFVGKSLDYIELAAESQLLENSFDNPELIIPVSGKEKGIGDNFDYSFKPNSYTILRIPVTVK